MRFQFKGFYLVLCAISSISATFKESKNKSFRPQLWNPVGSYNYPDRVNYNNPHSKQDLEDEAGDNNNDGGASRVPDIPPEEKDPDSDSKDMDMAPQIPQINFYSTFPNSIGVLSNGLLWFRELSAAFGTPWPLWIFTIPTILFSIALLFMPDLGVLNLPLFYPSGTGTDDPLAAFPPILDFEYEDVQKLKDAVQKLLKPPANPFQNLMSERVNK